MRNKRSTSISIVTLCIVSAAAAGEVSVKFASYGDIPVALAKFNYGNVAREQYIATVFGPFRQLDRNADGLTATEVDIVDQVELAQRSALALGAIYGYDLNNDGKIERAEVETVVASRTGDTAALNASQVNETMKADSNGDGVVEFREARNYNSPLIRGGPRWAEQGRQLLVLDPNKDGRLTVQELETLARSAFAAVDLDGNGIVSLDESMSFEQAKREKLNKR